MLDYGPVLEPISAYLDSRPAVPGAAVHVETFGGVVLAQRFWGDVGEATAMRIGSATKLISGTAIAIMASEDIMPLDRRVDEVLPEFGASGVKGGMTVAQLFSHTSGLPGILQSRYRWSDPRITIEQSVAGIASGVNLVAFPGRTFNYGGMSMQVAGRMAEVSAGSPFVVLMRSTLLGPLGMNDTDYRAFGPTRNPRVGGGARSSLRDYTTLLRALAQSGTPADRGPVTRDVAEMVLTDRAADARLRFIPGPVDAYNGYGIGSFVLRRGPSGRPAEFASPGAFGTYPWIDLEHGYFGVFMVDDDLDPVDPLIDAVRAFTREGLANYAACPADLNGDGALDTTDVGLAAELVEAQDPRADLDASGVTDMFDIALYQAGLDKGCAQRPLPSR